MLILSSIEIFDWGKWKNWFVLIQFDAYCVAKDRLCLCTIPKSGEKNSLIPFFLAGCCSAVRGCKTSRWIEHLFIYLDQQTPNVCELRVIRIGRRLIYFVICRKYRYWIVVEEQIKIEKKLNKKQDDIIIVCLNFVLFGQDSIKQLKSIVHINFHSKNSIK